MAIKQEPSANYPFILVPEDSRAFPDTASAIRELRKHWAAQQPAQRGAYFIARVETFVEPDYEVGIHEEAVQRPQQAGPTNGNAELLRNTDQRAGGCIFVVRSAPQSIEVDRRGSRLRWAYIASRLTAKPPEIDDSLGLPLTLELAGNPQKAANHQ